MYASNRAARRRGQFQPIPNTNEVTVVFPVSQATGRYDTSVYVPYMTKNQLSEDAVRSFLTRLEESVQNFKDVRVSGKLCCLYLLSFVLFIGMYVAGIFMTTDATTCDYYYDNDCYTDQGELTLGIILIVSSVLTMIVPIICWAVRY
mmetsp:Transcript_11187/g.9565  ORF Transcript_11187/g.9565 Transcript_11187/m.9565 type:complete len:147 (-) Transcript_11187:460-900(-)|eukprot:CAMPEP_0114600458 /NCGR_PEP_ID=MMETSP0125-20121206/23052_1 /TAXON_ID=485358 ORGANISM="Aristerostoma sp., Strain ATCC 50986" /NCGR_SAMPLE_ID=MMETSP0125 /ASSEMBLY_ACC=CAM_ASM_000245 /LENGTH=146 /DNA_ID=CAMNT_0001808657 /DNA_START=39 /DNA_END=479 /DNA_ORIENTATION=-